LHSQVGANKNEEILYRTSVYPGSKTIYKQALNVHYKVSL